MANALSLLAAVRRERHAPRRKNRPGSHGFHPAVVTGRAAEPPKPEQLEPVSVRVTARKQPENRRKVHYLKEAEDIASYIRTEGLTQAEAAARLGWSPSSVANKLRLLRLSPACRAALVKTGLSERHARCLLRIAAEEDRLRALEHMARHRLSAAQSERYVRELPEKAAGRRKFILKDLQMLLNSLDRCVALAEEAGVKVQTRRLDTEDAILLAFRIPRKPPETDARKRTE